jgi:hypothetical protein
MRIFFIILLTAYLTFSVMVAALGISGANSKDSGCAVKIRGEILLPAYRLGCYLGERVDE